MINRPDIPLGHIIPAHQTFGWCAHCSGRTPAEELVVWRTRELRRMVDEARQADTAGEAGPSVRDRLRRAFCEASGFDWDPDSLEPDEYGGQADAALAIFREEASR